MAARLRRIRSNSEPESGMSSSVDFFLRRVGEWAVRRKVATTGKEAGGPAVEGGAGEASRIARVTEREVFVERVVWLIAQAKRSAIERKTGVGGGALLKVLAPLRGGKVSEDAVSWDGRVLSEGGLTSWDGAALGLEGVVPCVPWLAEWTDVRVGGDSVKTS